MLCTWARLTQRIRTARFPQCISLEGKCLQLQGVLPSPLYFTIFLLLFPSLPNSMCFTQSPSHVHNFPPPCLKGLGEPARGVACRPVFKSEKAGSPKSGLSERLSRTRANPMKMVGRRTGHSSPYRGVSHHRYAYSIHAFVTNRSLLLFPHFEEAWGWSTCLYVTRSGLPSDAFRLDFYKSRHCVATMSSWQEQDVGVAA